MATQIKYGTTNKIFDTPRLVVERCEDERYCNLCDYKENDQHKRFETPMYKIVYSNSDEMRQTNSVMICSRHAKVLGMAVRYIVEDASQG